MAQPFLLMIAGPNGSGKTTLTDRLRQENFDLGDYINPDEIAAELQGSLEERSLRAQEIADQRRNTCIEQRKSFTFETVMSHPSKVDILVRAKEAGFFVQLYFIGTDDYRTNIDRVTLRVSRGGHDVPLDKIAARWTRSMELLSKAIRSSDVAFVFDNSAAGHIDVGPRLVFRRTFTPDRNLPRHEQFGPIPLWVRRYVLRPLGIRALNVHENLVALQPPRVPILHRADTARAEQTTPQSQLPFDLQTEQVLLGAILSNNERFYSVADFLESRHFFEPIHQRIFEAVANLIRQGRLAAPVTLKSFLPDAMIADLTTGNYLARLAAEAMNLSLSSQVLEKYGRIVRDLGVRRALIAMCEDTLKSAYEAPLDANVIELVERAERQLYEIAQNDLAQTGEHTGGPERLGHALVAAIDSAARAYMHDNALPGLSTGLADLDRKTGGLQPADLIVLSGRSGMGKTSLAINIAFNVARSWKGEAQSDGSILTTSGGIVGYFSLQMSAEQLATLIISSESRIPVTHIRTGRFGEAEFERIRDVTLELESIPLYIDETGSLTFAQIAARARRLKRQRGLDFIVIDNVQLLHKSHEHGESDDLGVQLKGLSKELNIPILAITELRDELTKPKDWRPHLSSLRVSEITDRYADTVIFVFREEYYLQNLRPSEGTEEHVRWLHEMEAVHGIAEIIIEKQRHGPSGTVLVGYDPEFARFSDLASSSLFEHVGPLSKA